MVAGAVALSLLLADPAGTATLAGVVRVTGPAQSRAVILHVEDKHDVTLTGQLADEVARLASMRVEVVGRREGDTLVVEGYGILDVGGGGRPLIGTVVQVGESLALRDGEGTPVPLSLAPRSRERLSQQIGAKIWVYGKKLVSGEIKVTRYGVLREVAVPQVPAGNTKPTGE